MKFLAYVDDEEHEIEIEPVEGGYKVAIGLTVRIVDSARLEASFYSLIVAGRSFEVSAREVARDSYEIYHGGYQRIVRIIDPLAAAAGAAVSGEGRAEVLATMPGRVVAILTSQGETVSAGQGLLVLEAMKMENEVTAPRSGTVTQLLVAEGETVRAGAILAVIG